MKDLMEADNERKGRGRQHPVEAKGLQDGERGWRRPVPIQVMGRWQGDSQFSLTYLNLEERTAHLWDSQQAVQTAETGVMSRLELDIWEH